MKKIVFFDIEERELNILKPALEKNYECIFITESIDDNFHVNKNIKNADIISCFTTSKLSSKTLSKFPNIKLIALRSVGFNNVDIDYCQKNNIFVENTPNYGNKSVAEFTFGLILDVVRKITHSYIDLKHQKIDHDSTIGFELSSKTIGIIGLGAIGQEVAKLSNGFDLNIIAF